jgi:hypothetical protein
MVVRVQVGRQALKISTCCFQKYSAVGLMSSKKATRGRTEKMWVVQPKQVVLEVAEDRSCEEFAVEEMKEEAFHDSPVFHTRLKKRFDALNELIQRLQARLGDNLVDCRKGDPKVVVDALHKRV